MALMRRGGIHEDEATPSPHLLLRSVVAVSISVSLVWAAIFLPGSLAQQSSETPASVSNGWATAQDIPLDSPSAAASFDVVTAQSCGNIDPQGSGLSLGTVTQGQKYSYTATGCVAWNTDNTGFSDADGNRYLSPGCVTANGQSQAGGAFFCSGLIAYSLVGKIAGGVCFQLSKEGCFTATASGELIAYFNDDIYGDNSGTWSVCLAPTTDATAFSEAASCSGFDAALDPHWLMVPTPGNNTAVLTFTEGGSLTVDSANTAIATVVPGTVVVSPNTITVTGIAKGTTKITVGSTTCGILKVTVKTKPTAKKVVIHAITEENDDVQVISTNKGLANQTCITPGPNGHLDSTPGGDDKKQGSNIHTGANGVCNTTAVGDDGKVIDLGKGLPFATCIKPGKNGFRDTTPTPDDFFHADSTIDDGLDGICNTTASAINVSPVNVPTDNALQNYLNSVFGKQANFYFSVTRVDKVVNYDLDRSGTLKVSGAVGFPSEEEQAIIDAVHDSTALNVYYVNDFSTNYLGYADKILGNAFIRDYANGFYTLNTSAHEIGHLLKLLHSDEGGCVEAGDDPTTRLMYSSAQASSLPCRLNKCEWDTVNP